MNIIRTARRDIVHRGNLCAENYRNRERENASGYIGANPFFIERFNRTYRTEIRVFYLFITPNEARKITTNWLMAEKPKILKCVELKRVCLQWRKSL
jgi:hypothetical protein